MTSHEPGSQFVRLQRSDPQIAAALDGERNRQEAFVELIASENYASPDVLAALGSTLTNKYADGYPGHRTYRGCEFVDVAETLACERACQLFGAQYANVQPYSGSQANAAALMALLKPGDKLLGMASSHGGHITHGHAESFSGQLYDSIQYGTDAHSGLIDYDEVATLAQQHRPRLIVAGYSAYSRNPDWARFRQIADDCGALLLIDMAHASGLIAAGLSPNPLPFADVCTSTTHKTLRGPRGGLILARDAERFGAALDRAVYPATQGGPLMHVVAAKAVAFAEALQPEFALYQRAVLDNAVELATALAARSLTIVTGGTDNHMMLVDLNNMPCDAAQLSDALERAHIAVSSWQLPGDASDGAPNGMRLGTPAVTTRGFGPEQMRALADVIADLAESQAGAQTHARELAAELCTAFPAYGPGSAWER